jgi:hypothetical protein
MESIGIRQTGRTTRAVEEAVRLANQGKRVIFIAHTKNMANYARSIGYRLMTPERRRNLEFASAVAMRHHVTGADAVVLDHHVVFLMNRGQFPYLHEDVIVWKLRGVVVIDTDVEGLVSMIDFYREMLDEEDEQ